MSERIAAPELIDLQVFLSEYVVLVSVSWLHALYSDFRMHRLLPALGKDL